MPPEHTYRDVVDIDTPELQQLAALGRKLLQLNDTLMCAELGCEYSIYKTSVAAALKVSMVHLTYGYLRRDDNMLAIALAALEVGLTAAQADDDPGRQKMNWPCPELCRLVIQHMDDLDEEERRVALRVLGKACGT